MSIREQMDRARLKVTQDAIFALHTQANIVQEYSDNPDHPNVSAYLRSGLVDTILAIEADAYAAGRNDR